MASTPSLRLVTLSLLLIAGHNAAWAQTAWYTVRGTVPADWPADESAPLAVPLIEPATGTETMQASVSIDGREGAKTFAQCEAADPIAGTPARAWLLLAAKPEDRGKPITITLAAMAKSSLPIAYQSAFRDPLVNIQTPAGRPVLSFRHGRPDPKTKYPITDYLHPILGLDGETISDLEPADHLHHRGVFWSWVRYDRKGEPIGDWWIPKGIACEAGELKTGDGPVFSQFRARHWLTHQAKNAPSPARFMQEDVICRVFPATSHGRAIDLEIALLALDEGVRIGGQTTLNKGYGGMTFRYGPAKQVEISLDGKVDPKDIVGGRGRWADWSGFFRGPDGQPLTRRSGAAVLVHPQHPNAPTTWLTRHYGALCVTWPGLQMIEVSPKDPLRLRYRLWVHRGNAVDGKVNDQYNAYAADWKWSHK
ncbi:MAG: PmoA family protein [Phycisphaerae bacterium]|nr:PmoA family protein [Phycisphaerae bacterium]